MRSKILIVVFISVFTNSIGQINPVENLTWSHWYEYPNNFFELQWEEPAQPHDELIGYNIYRNDEFYQFQEGTSLYNLYTDLYGIVTNCSGVAFLLLPNPNPDFAGFNVHVTAVYSSGMESDFTQTIYVNGPLLSSSAFPQNEAILFPNPANGVLNIGNVNLKNIALYDISGKEIMTFTPSPQIDLSGLSKGIYIIKLRSQHKIIVEKIVIE